MPVLNPDHLLDQAERLTRPLAGGPPRQADLRRAISSAYYAVFHEILTSAADDFAGKTKRNTSRYALVYRSVSHRSLKDVCEDIGKTDLPARYLRYEPQGGFGADVQAMANAVVDLQQKRHLADYDPLYRAIALDARIAVATARTALTRFRHASQTRRKAFLSLVVFAPR